ncbi:carbohydrate ABC transporter permease [Faecalicatena orotica]|uniref:Carbohydrate ABC transporter membrane protein 2 (CUT1 family) n=1 Tax=Faecalicatena orotica TaxID=1544 RepID=A0A2Y9BJ39_9FIRM|nr:carbohydrate ABC transporter permease [Faecalicatena orotica]PWJ22921.1 carbohydrate ABC transporter membrane protein 2 (CUT1 family) [Faecalicatena orotica]SSA58057.1 carbohydrate ABC transporter membrane protein 2, CUT1 family [Faecalicatena orotica]
MNKKVGSDKLKKGILYIVAVLLAAITFLPLIITLLSSFKTNEDILLGMFSLPKKWVFNNYPSAVETANAIRSIGNSLFVAVATLIATVIIALPAAYVLARKPYKYLKGVYFLFMAGVMVPVHSTLVSISKISSSFGARNSYFFLILIYVAFNLSQAIFLFTGYIGSLDRGLDEAAKIDGCGDGRMLISIMAPICKPIIATEAILVFIYGYSELIFSLILISDSSKYTVSRAMLNFTSNYTTSYGPQFAFVIMSMIPMLIIYLLLHEKVESGILAGAIKG